jgi:tetratricopeptide (TPR) repeat protein
MEINKPLKSEHLILLNARKVVVITLIIFVIYTFGSTYLLGYKIINYANYNTIFTLLLIIHAIFCGRLYNVMSKNITLSLIIGILIIVLSWFALGIGTLLLTIYLLVKSNTALKKLDLNFAIPSKKITSLVSTEENKTPITEEVFGQENKVKKDLDCDEAYKKALYFIDKEEYDKALLYLEIAIKTDIISLKEKVYLNIGFCYGNLANHVKAIEAFKQVIRIDPDHTNAHFSLGFSYFKIGDKSSALDEYKILKELDIDKANKLFDTIY